jgi:hypothetical protein
VYTAIAVCVCVILKIMEFTIYIYIYIYTPIAVYSIQSSKCKGKAVPLQARRVPEGSRKLSFPDFVTTTQGGGKGVSLTHRPPLPPGNTPGTHFC